ncbi:MAG: isochorismatase family protein [Dehalococcoidia bacterium]|nr:isochorismatase family protein [Dehalococcoidia bacterium]
MAVWDPFLTDQDRQHLEYWGKTSLAGFGEKPAVLVIDDYYSVLGLEREPLFESMKKWPMSCGLAGWEAIDSTVELLRMARASDIEVIYARGLENFPKRSSWARRGSKAMARTELSPDEEAMGNEIVAEVAPMPGELVIEKAAASAFHGTPLLFHLVAQGIDTLIVCGETTSGCVRASVVDACTYRFKVGVVEECCFDRTEAAHALNLFDMHQKYADVVDMDTVAGYFAEITKPQPVHA